MVWRRLDGKINLRESICVKVGFALRQKPPHWLGSLCQVLGLERVSRLTEVIDQGPTLGGGEVLLYYDQHLVKDKQICRSDDVPCKAVSRRAGRSRTSCGRHYRAEDLGNVNPSDVRQKGNWWPVTNV